MRFDAVSGTTRHLAKGMILASCRVCKDASKSLAIEGRKKVEKIRRNSWAYFSSDDAGDESVASPVAGPTIKPRRRHSWANIFQTLDEVH